MKRLRLLNLIAYLFMIVINFLAYYLPLNGKTTGEISNSINSLFTPAGYTFMIWGLIYLLLGGFVLYQLKLKQKHNNYVNATGVYFIMTCLFNGLWLFAWHYEKFWLSVLIMILLLICLIKIYNRLDIGNCNLKKVDKRFINLPFSVYFAWICVATIANVAATLKYTGWNGLGLSETIWTVVVIIFGAILALYISLKNNDLAFMLTFLWAFIGILIRHWGCNNTIAITVIAVIVVLVLQIISKIKTFLYNN